jgi:PTS system mannose-specific IIA component
MIGIVVVTHGRVAEELVSAARTIHGELSGMVAVPLGWGDDASQAKAAIEKGIAESGGGDTLVLTDMFGGTPTNLSLPFLSQKVEIVTGVSLPMLIKAAGLREGALADVARAVREQGKGAIVVASEVLAARKP